MSDAVAEDLSDLSLNGGEDDEWDLPTRENVQSNEEANEFCYVGMCLTTARVHFDSLASTMADIWRSIGGVAMEDIGGKRFLVKFYNEVDCENFEIDESYAFNNHLIITHRMRPREKALNVPLLSSMIWVQAHNVPDGWFTEAMAKQLGNFIGEYQGYDERQPRRGTQTFLRIRVKLDIRNPLSRRKKIKIRGWKISSYSSMSGCLRFVSYVVVWDTRKDSARLMCLMV